MRSPGQGQISRKGPGGYLATENLTNNKKYCKIGIIRFSVCRLDKQEVFSRTGKSRTVVCCSCYYLQYIISVHQHEHIIKDCPRSSQNILYE